LGMVGKEHQHPVGVPHYHNYTPLTSQHIIAVINRVCCFIRTTRSIRFRPDRVDQICREDFVTDITSTFLINFLFLVESSHFDLEAVLPITQVGTRDSVFPNLQFLDVVLMSSMTTGLYRIYICRQRHSGKCDIGGLLRRTRST